MDEVDQQILRSFAANARISLKVLAGKGGLAAPRTSDRLRRLEERGQIMGYTRNTQDHLKQPFRGSPPFVR
jgi:Lrp/AsnC family leucine-responsive transcriptional regulator